MNKLAAVLQEILDSRSYIHYETNLCGPDGFRCVFCDGFVNAHKSGTQDQHKLDCVIPRAQHILDQYWEEPHAAECASCGIGCNDVASTLLQEERAKQDVMLEALKQLPVPNSTGHMHVYYERFHAWYAKHGSPILEND